LIGPGVDGPAVKPISRGIVSSQVNGSGRKMIGGDLVITEQNFSTSRRRQLCLRYALPAMEQDESFAMLVTEPTDVNGAREQAKSKTLTITQAQREKSFALRVTAQGVAQLVRV